MITLSNYKDNGLYNIMTSVTLVSVLHSCDKVTGRLNVINQTYDTNPINQTIAEFVPNSEYNITVVISNAVGSTTQSVTEMTLPEGKVQISF